MPEVYIHSEGARQMTPPSHDPFPSSLAPLSPALLPSLSISPLFIHKRDQRQSKTTIENKNEQKETKKRGKHHDEKLNEKKCKMLCKIKEKLRGRPIHPHRLPCFPEKKRRELRVRIPTKYGWPVEKSEESEEGK